MLIFDDDSVNDWNRQKVLERLSQVTLPQGCSRRWAPIGVPVGQIYWYTLQSTNPAVRPDGAEVARGLDAGKAVQVRSRMSWMWPASEARRANIRCAVDPNKLIAYGLSIGQVEQQLANNNVNAGGSFIEAGLQQVNVRAVGLVRPRAGHRSNGA